MGLSSPYSHRRPSLNAPPESQRRALFEPWGPHDDPRIGIPERREPDFDAAERRELDVPSLGTSGRSARNASDRLPFALVALPYNRHIIVLAVDHSGDALVEASGVVHRRSDSDTLRIRS